MSEYKLLLYNELLEKIKNQENHLLLGNGFNRGLGVNTSYEAIFSKMIKENHGIYKEVEDIVKDCGYDLEKFIGKIIEDINLGNDFLKKYTSNKIKLDFMKSAHEIVKEEIKNVYVENNQGIYILLQSFTNFFTLNYDSLVYLLLLNFKEKNNEIKTLSFQTTLNFQKEDINTVGNNIYFEIQQARKNGTLVIGVTGDDTTVSHLSESTKGIFTFAVKDHFKSKGWKGTEVDRVIDKIWEEEKEIHVLKNINDGFKIQQLFPGSKEKEYVFDVTKEIQNLFFLHGAFHIYKDGEDIKKITQKENVALYDRLEEILNKEDNDIITVFKDENKIDEIIKNDYLTKCYNKLSTLKGNLVIIGCSFSDNDKHIFDQINKSTIENLYINSREQKSKNDYEKLTKIFPEKNIYLFATDSISYELPKVEIID